MPYLVDGSNLGGRVGGGAAGARDRAGVLRLLLPLARGRRRIVVVFDGPEDAALARGYGPLEVRFAGARSADAAILALLGKRPADWWVVSEDRGLLAACRERHARTMSIRDFLGRPDVAAGLAPTRSRTGSTEEPADEPVDVADWEDWFRRGGG